jgi:redox-sensing transcriptional repressor
VIVSQKTIGRLSLYRRLLQSLSAKGVKNIYSHQMASIAGVTAAQVRRDWMVIGYTGSPTHGYEVGELIESIGKFLDSPVEQKVALVGVGNLGRAILIYFSGRRPKLNIVAAFDNDPYKVNRVIHGCRCFPIDQIKDISAENGITVGVIAVPASEAQAVADKMVTAGIKGILNFAPTPLRVGPGIFVDDIDMTMSLEKVAYFARQNADIRTHEQNMIGSEIQ